MADITQLELNPREGVIKSIGGPVSNPVSEEVLKKSILNKTENAKTAEPAPSNSGVSGSSGGGDDGPGTGEAPVEAKPTDQNLEVADKQPDLENDPKFRAIAKREREFRARESQVKQMLARRENDLNQRIAQFEAQQSEKLQALTNFNSLADNARKNPEPYLRFVFGDNWYDNAVQFKLSGRPVPELVAEQIENKFSQEMEQMRQERDLERQEREKERQQGLARQKAMEQAEYDETISQYFVETENYIKQKPDTYELIHMQGKPAMQLVSQLIQANFYQTGQLMTPQEAAEKVENYLTEQYKSYSRAKKFASKQEEAPVQGQTIDQRLSEVRNPNPGAKTLTNQMTASTPTVMTNNSSEQARIRRAIAAMDAASKR